MAVGSYQKLSVGQLSVQFGAQGRRLSNSHRPCHHHLSFPEQWPYSVIRPAEVHLVAFPEYIRAARQHHVKSEDGRLEPRESHPHGRWLANPIPHLLARWGRPTRVPPFPPQQMTFSPVRLSLGYRPPSPSFVAALKLDQADTRAHMHAQFLPPGRVQALLRTFEVFGAIGSKGSAETTSAIISTPLPESTDHHTEILSEHRQNGPNFIWYS